MEHKVNDIITYNHNVKSNKLIKNITLKDYVESQNKREKDIKRTARPC